MDISASDSLLCVCTHSLLFFCCHWICCNLQETPNVGFAPQQHQVGKRYSALLMVVLSQSRDSRKRECDSGFLKKKKV